MFGFLKSNPEEKLNKAYSAKLEAAMLAQRKGDIKLYASLTAESEAILAQLNELGKNKG